MIGYGNSLGVYILNPYIYGGAPSFTNTKSLLFDGIDEYLNNGAVTAFDGATNFSVSFWVKIPTLATKYPIGAGGTGNGWQTTVTATGLLQWTFNSGSTNYVRALSALTANTWHHIVLAYDGGGGSNNFDKAKMYVDGNYAYDSQAGTIPTSMSTVSSGGSMWISRGSITSSVYTNQYVDEVAVFNYTLDATQASSLYNSGTPTDLDNTSGVTAPVHWWRMGDGDTFPTITDVGTVGGFDGTMTNQESGDIVSDVPS